jgi:hypothetical protein
MLVTAVMRGITYIEAMKVIYLLGMTGLQRAVSSQAT